MKQWEYLKKLSKMETAEDIPEFEKKIWDLAATKDPVILGNLIDLFDDECLYPEVMYSLVHAIETYPNEIYVICVLNKAKTGLILYPHWIQVLLYRILNDDNCYKLLRTHMDLADKNSLLKLFEVMEEASPPHKELIENLRKELQEENS